MRITDTNKSGAVGKSGKADKKKSTGDASAFESLLDAGAAASTSAKAGTSGMSATTSIDALLALQGVGDATDDENKQKATQRAQTILDRLDDVRIGLLTGVIRGDQLYQLKHAIDQQRTQFTDPRLQEILDEIDLRARVEIAKLEVAQQQKS